MSLRNFKQKALRFLALLCCCFLLFSAIPISVNAASVEETLAKDLYEAVKSKKSKVKIKKPLMIYFPYKKPSFLFCSFIALPPSVINLIRLPSPPASAFSFSESKRIL